MIYENIAGFRGRRLIILAIAMSIVFSIASGAKGPNELQKNAPFDAGKSIAQEQYDPLKDRAGVTTSAIKITKEYEENIFDGEQYITYIIKVSNDGGTGLENVTLVDSLPDGLGFNDAKLSLYKKGNTEKIDPIKPIIDYTKTYANLTWILGDLGINEIATINMKVKKQIPTIKPTANKAYAWGNWTNSTDNTVVKVSAKAVANKASVEGNSKTTAPQASEANKIYDPTKYASLVVAQKIIMIPPGKADSNITYWIKVKNTGEILLKNVTVTDILPSGLEYLQSNYLNSSNLSEKLLLTQTEYNGNGTIKKIAWNLGDLNTGQDKWIELKVVKLRDKVDESNNKLQANGTAFDTTIGSDSGLASKQSAKMNIVSRLTDIKGSNNGFQADYSIKIKNIKDFGMKNLWIQDKLPPKASYLDSTCTKSLENEVSDINPEISIDTNNGIVLWKIDEIAPNETVKIDFSALLRHMNPLKNRAKASGFIETMEVSSNFIKTEDYRY